jgi:hypothetical protein
MYQHLVAPAAVLSVSPLSGWPYSQVLEQRAVVYVEPRLLVSDSTVRAPAEGTRTRAPHLTGHEIASLVVCSTLVHCCSLLSPVRQHYQYRYYRTTLSHSVHHSRVRLCKYAPSEIPNGCQNGVESLELPIRHVFSEEELPPSTFPSSC